MREFESVRKNVGATVGGADRSARPAHSLALVAETALLAAASRVAEIEPAEGELAELILSRHENATYTGIFRERLAPEAADRLSAFGSRAKLARGGAEGELPLETNSQDALLSCYALETMRMSHLYMACGEARRVLREGGHWLILARDPGRNAWERALAFYRRKTGRPSLNVTHYISPEDWDTERDILLPKLNRLLILKRRSG